MVTANKEREEETMIENQKAVEKVKEKERQREREREEEGDRENEGERRNERDKDKGESRKGSHLESVAFSLITSTEKGYALDVIHARNMKRMNVKGSDSNSNNNSNSNSHGSADRGGMITDADYEVEEPRRSSRNRFLALEKSCALKGFDVYGRPLSLREKGDRAGSGTGIDGDERDFLESAERGDSSLYQQSVLGIGYGPDGPYMLHENSATNVDEEDGLHPYTAPADLDRKAVGLEALNTIDEDGNEDGEKDEFELIGLDSDSKYAKARMINTHGTSTVHIQDGHNDDDKNDDSNKKDIENEYDDEENEEGSINENEDEKDGDSSDESPYRRSMISPPTIPFVDLGLNCGICPSMEEINGIFSMENLQNIEINFDDDADHERSNSTLR